MRENTAQTVEAYIAQFSGEARQRMEALRALLKKELPDAVEKISWDMPTYAQFGNIIHFAGHQKHIGIYPGAEGVAHFLPKLGDYQTSKGGIQLPYAKPMPWELIAEIARFRLAENIRMNEEKLASKAAQKRQKNQ